jgi:formylmethanofuran dehydrogenase subunit E
LLREIESAGDSVCSIAPVRVNPRLLGHAHMGDIAICPGCGEAFPCDDGPLCRSCQGEAPYLPSGASRPPRPAVRVLPVEEAVGKTVLHDMTEVIPGRSKGAAFSAGQAISVGDVCRLQHMGRFSVAVADGVPNGAPDGADGGADSGGFVHENAGAEAFARRMAGRNIAYDLPPREGKINFRATCSGLFTLDRARLNAFNMLPDVMAATRQDGILVDEGSEVAGTRVIPLYLDADGFARALSFLDAPLFSVAPLRAAKVGILVTGTEVFQGLIEDKFIPVIATKVEQLRCTVVKTAIVPDDAAAIVRSIDDIRAAGADLLVTTGGLSVDPEDITRAALVQAGLTNVLHGAPVLPGTMTLTGMLPGGMQVIGVPACALYFKTTLFDAILPRLLAGRNLTRAELAAMGEGGFCMNCKVCTWPKCFFLK